MLGGADVIATVSVKDLAVARRFYERTLGLEVVHVESGEALRFRSGNSELIVYRSQFAGTNKATALNWNVGDRLEAIVAALRAKDVSFEHYDLPGATRQGDIHVFGAKFKNAWFKDPDGNILALMGV